MHGNGDRRRTRAQQQETSIQNMGATMTPTNKWGTGLQLCSTYFATTFIHLQSRQLSLGNGRLTDSFPLFVYVQACVSSRIHDQKASKRHEIDPLHSPLFLNKKLLPTMAKIKLVEHFRVKPRWLFVKITDEEGKVGWGEGTLEGHSLAVEGALDEIIVRIVGLEAK